MTAPIASPIANAYIDFSKMTLSLVGGGDRRGPRRSQGLRYGGMRPDRDDLRFDCALSYGLCEYHTTLAALLAAGWSPARCIQHGGHQMSLNIAAGLGLGGNESYPDLFQPEDGHIVMPELPGIGFEGKADFINVMQDLAQ